MVMVDGERGGGIVDYSVGNIDHFCVTSHMTKCVFGHHVGGKTKKNKKSF